MDIYKFFKVNFQISNEFYIVTMTKQLFSLLGWTDPLR